MHLDAPTPAAWLERHFAAYFIHHAEVLSSGRAFRTLTLAEALAGDGRELRLLHDGMTGEGTPRKPASKYLAGWFGGLVATGLGFAYAASDAGFLVEADALAWHFHPDGWTDGVDLGAAVAVVESGHPWAGQAGVRVAASRDEVCDAVAGALADAVAPVVELLAAAGGLGATGLWAEVSDGFACGLVYQDFFRPGPGDVAAVDALTAAAGPWRTRPSVWTLDITGGPMALMQKGGCCMSYTEQHHEHDPDEEDEDHRAFHAAFPEPGAPAYCPTCPLRPRGQCEEQQRWWGERERAGAADAGG